MGKVLRRMSGTWEGLKQKVFNIIFVVAIFIFIPLTGSPSVEDGSGDDLGYLDEFKCL